MVTIKNRPRQESQFIDVFDEDQVQKAIVYRKAKYDEGAEKIQNQINQLGQIPTITEEDAKIVQDKINSLVNNTNSIVGLDTSNQFNVNKLSSMATEVADDPEVQAAVSSARNHQKNIKFIEEAKLNPKKYGNIVAVQNEDDYFQKLNQYKQDRALGKQTVFSYSYKPYKDVEGILSKEMEKIKSDISMGLAGNYFNKDETVTPQRIREIAFNRINSDTSLSEQVRINSSYSTRGVPDESVLAAKNKLQLAELKNRRHQAEKRFTDLYSVDLQNGKEAAKLVAQAKKEIENYDKYSKFLTANPNKIIDIESGEQQTGYNRNQLAYELSMFALADGLTNKFAFNKRTISANPIPMKEKELNWKMQMDKLDYDLDVREVQRKIENDKIDNQLKSLEIKEKLKIDETGNKVSLGMPEEGSALSDNPQPLVDDMVKTSKLETTNLLKDVIRSKFNAIQGISGSGANSQFLDKFIDSMLTPEGQIKNLAEDENIKRLQAGAKASTGTIPDARLLREGIKFVNRLSKDVKNIWNNDKTVSLENAKVLKEYTDGIHQISTLNAANDYAMQAGLKAAGITKEEYNKLSKLNYNYKEQMLPNMGYSSNTAGAYTGKATMPSPEDRAKIETFNKAKAEYFNKKLATTKIYPVVNFNEKADPKAFNDVKIDISRYITEGVGADITGSTSVGNIYGKTDKWSDLQIDKSQADIEPIDYSPKSGIAKVKINYKDKDGKDAQRIAKFYINPTLMNKHIPKDVTEASKNLTYTDALNLSDSGTLQAKTYDSVNKRYVIKDVWKTTVNPIPITWKAQKVNPKDVGSNEVNVYLQIPFNGEMIPFKMNRTFSNADVAGEQLTQLVNNTISALQKQGLNASQIKQELLKYLQTSNGGI